MKKKMTFPILDILSWASFAASAFFLLIGALGMVRLPDFWARLHAASIIDTAGLAFLILGLMFQSGLSLVTVKLALIIVFLVITGPTASHAVANAAFVSGARPSEKIESPPASAKAKK